MSYKILFLGGGRRVSLAKIFQKNDFIIYSYETDKKSPISSVGKVIEGLPWSQLKNPDMEGRPNVKDIGLDIIKCVIQNKIDLVLPLDDCAAALLPQTHLPAEIYPSCDLSGALTGFDKKYLQTVFGHKDYFPIAITGEDYVIKPRFGNSSIGVAFNKKYDLMYQSDKEVYQRHIRGTEYTVDCYFSKKCELLHYVPRIRLRVAGGEVIDSITKYEPSLDAIMSDIAKTTAFRGPICVQFIKEDVSGKWYMLEINSRFGGGSILSIEAGLDIPKYIKTEYLFNCNVVAPIDIKYELLMRRVNTEVFYENSN